MLKTFECQHCNKQMSTKQSMQRHIITCKSYIEKKHEEEKQLIIDENERLKEEIIDFKIENERLKEENKRLKEEIIEFKKETEKEKELIKIETEKEMYKSFGDFHARGVMDIAKQPKTITSNSNTNNIKNKLTAPFDLKDQKTIDSIKEKLRLTIDRGCVMDGQKGLARHIYNIIIKDRGGKIKYVCADTSRGIFRYMDENGNVYNDYQAKTLTEIILDAITNNLFQIITDLEELEENKEEDPSIIQYIRANICQIKNMNSDNADFRKELIILTSKQIPTIPTISTTLTR